MAFPEYVKTTKDKFKETFLSLLLLYFVYDY